MIGYVLLSKSGKPYIGITNDLGRRLREHRNRGPMSKSSFVVLSTEVFTDVGSAAAWEISEIERIGIENTMNTSLGGFGGRKRFCSFEEKVLMSERAIVRYLSAENREKTGLAVRRAFSEVSAREKLSASAKAACARPEVKARRSASQKEAWADPEVRARHERALKVANSDPAKAEQRSLAAKKRWEKRRSEA